MPSTERSRSCIMARKEGSRSCKARNGWVGEGERLEEEKRRGQRNIHDCYPAIAWRVNGRGFEASQRLGGLER